MSDKHSQTATEYLIILAVVIVIALIVVGVLGGIPSIGGGASESSAKIQLASLKVGIANYKQDSHSTLLQFTNNNPSAIRIDEMWINDKKCTLYPYRAILGPGQNRKITCYGVTGLDEGSRFDYDFNVTYTDISTSAQYLIEPDVKLVGKIAKGSELHTGQTSSYCYDLTGASGYGIDGPVSCTSSHYGQDGYIDGTEKTFTSLSDNVIKDEYTGLYWTTNETADITRTNAIAYCDGLTQGGSSNWRLPNIVELTTVMNSGTAYNPSPNGEWTNDAYWSSTSQSDPYYWYLYFEDGYFMGDRTENAAGASVRAVCVRGTTTVITLSDGEKSFVDIGDGTVVDTDTGIIWTKAANYTSSNYWNNSIAYCDSLETGEYTDWRLPTASEGVTLIDYGDADYKNDAFDWTAVDHYRTGTTVPSYTANAYIIKMANGYVNWGPNDKDYATSVRCVRDR